MPLRTVQLVLHYDGLAFHGWQRQPSARTVQGELEAAVAKLVGAHVAVTGAGRTDAGVHARGQAAGVVVPARWTAVELRRALNATLPCDVWVAAAHEMRGDFHARFTATARAYRYQIGTDDAAASPFRARYEWRVREPLDLGLLQGAAALVTGEHEFRAFAVRGTAPPHDDHRCTVHNADWCAVPGKLIFSIGANRFLHHMVRFLVGTMVEVASGKRTLDSLAPLLAASDNHGAAPPAPAHALFLERVSYPPELYLTAATI